MASEDATADRDQQLMLILDAYLQAVESGTAPDRREWLAQHPEFAAELSQFLDEQESLMKLTEPLHAVAARAGLATALGSDCPEAKRNEIEEHAPEPHSPAALNGVVDRTVSPATHRFGDYELLDEIAHGGMGTVFKARQRSLNRIVAIKVVRGGALATDDDRKRFRQEAEAVAALDHPNIVPIYEVGEYDGLSYFSMKLASGGSVAERLSHYTADLRSAAKLVATVARAIQYAHERGILHRDLKPSNIVIDEHGQPQVSDFGLAKRMEGDSELTQSGTILGTPSYMAPEQALGKRKAIGTATDVYGLGAVLYTLVTGRPPFRGDSVLETIEQVKKSEPEPPSGVNRRVNRDLQTICLKCLEKEPERRYVSAQDVAVDLERFLAGESILARRSRLWERVRRRARRHPAVLVAIVLLGLFGATLLAARSRLEAEARERVQTGVNFLAARSWLERQLAADPGSDRRLQAEARERAQRARRAQYLADIRLAYRFVQENRPRDADELLVRHRPGADEEDLREFAWYHLWHCTHPKPRALNGHRGDVYHVEFSPRGNLLASAGKDGTVLIWETSGWQLVQRIVAAETEVNVAAFSPDGEAIATVDDDGILKLWDVTTGHCRLEKLAHKGEAGVARFTRDGQRIVTGGRKDGLVKVWDRASGAMLDSFRAANRDVENAALSPDGTMLATVGDKGVDLWTWPGRAPIISLGPAGYGVTFSHNGRMLATDHSKDKSVRIWELPSGRLIREFPGHTECLTSVAFSTDDQTIVSASDDATIRAWDVSTGVAKAVHQGRSGKIWNLALSPDGQTIASAGADGEVKLWDVEIAHRGFGLPIGYPWGFVFAPDSRSVVVFETSPQWAVSRWDIRSRSLIERKPVKFTGLMAGHCAAFSHNCRLLAISTTSGTIILYDLTTGDYQTIGDPTFGILRDLDFSPDDRFLRFRRPSPMPKLMLWDTESRRLIQNPLEPPGELMCWTSSQAVVAELAPGLLRWWYPATGQTRSVSCEPPVRFPSLALSTDHRVTAAREDPSQRRIQLWSAATRKLEQECACRILEWGALVNSPDGKTLASAGLDHTIKLWDVATGGDILTLEGFGGLVWYPRFSPDGKVLAGFGEKTAAELPREIRLWLAAEDEPQSPQGETGSSAGSERSN
jgi:eukaryotic-like serine/threonine-protein kinase